MVINERFLKLLSTNEWRTILDKYSFDDLFRLNDDRRLIKSFYIPPEIILSSYKTSRTLIDKDHGWANTYLDKIINTVTNGILNAKDYIDIFMLRILDGIGPKCIRCKKPLNFTGKISCPYRGVHCSRSCGTSDMNYRLWNIENSPFKTEEYKKLKKRLAKEMAREGKIGLINKSCSLGNTLSIYSKYDEMYFYIIEDDSKFKIGISHTTNAESRIYVSTIYKFDKDKSKCTIYKGLTNDIVQLENEIKFNTEFINHRYYPNSSTEGWMETFNADIINKIYPILNKYNIQRITN